MIVWKGHKAKVRSLAFSPDGRFIATTAGNSKFIWLWDATSGQLVRQLTIGFNPVRVAAFIGDGRYILGVYEQLGGSIWEVETGTVVARLLVDNWQHAEMMAVSPDGSRLLLVVGGALAEWNHPARACEEPRYCDRTRPVTSGVGYYPLRLAFSPLGTYFCVMHQNLELLDPTTHRRIHHFFDRDGANASAIAFTPDESRMVVAFGHRAAVWQMERPNEKPVALRGHENLVRAVGFLPGGNTVLTAAMDGTVRLWDANTGVEQRAFDWGIGKVRVAAVSPDGNLCAAGGDNGRLVIWDVDV